jgi:hypothetical protein
MVNEMQRYAFYNVFNLYHIKHLYSFNLIDKYLLIEINIIYYAIIYFIKCIWFTIHLINHAVIKISYNLKLFFMFAMPVYPSDKDAFLVIFTFETTEYVLYVVAFFFYKLSIKFRTLCFINISRFTVNHNHVIFH